jgi:hypothetical protein
VQAHVIREAGELERLGHEYQVQASQLLRSARAGWEAWFEAGLELKRAAQRLRLISGPPLRFGAPRPAKDVPAPEARLPRRVLPSRPQRERA